MNFEKYCVIIKDGLENFIINTNSQYRKYNLFIISINEIEQLLNSIKEDLKKEHLLLVMNYNFINTANLNYLINFFSSQFNFTLPYILYLIDKEITIEEQDNITKGDNFFYYLPDNTDNEIYEKNFNVFINSIFDKLTIIERLNYYIVDSFQNIIDATIISNQKNEIEKLNKEIIEISKIDYLTNVLNRRAFFEALEIEKKRTLRDHWRFIMSEFNGKIENEEFFIKHYNKKPEGNFLDHYGRFSCILFDIDYFKKINDNYGHIIGDKVLKKIGEILKNGNIFRENDIIARYGGEEFIIILPETNAENAKIPAERLREYIKKVKFYDQNNNEFFITISIGISEFSIYDTSNEELIKRADKALYYAKQTGRDRVVVYNSEMN